MTNYEDFKKEQLKDPEVKKEYDLIQKRIEIREGITDIIKESVPNFIYPFLMIPTRWLVNKILKFLHSQGVVIKSKNQKVPITFGGILKDNKDIFRVEPLIKE